jgi:hypothetical protein
VVSGRQAPCQHGMSGGLPYRTRDAHAQRKIEMGREEEKARESRGTKKLRQSAEKEREKNKRDKGTSTKRTGKIGIGGVCVLSEALLMM